MHTYKNIFLYFLNEEFLFIFIFSEILKKIRYI